MSHTTIVNRPTIVILDDDPTGTQAVADVAVVTSTERADLEWAFDASPRGFFVLTNSRSLDEPDMIRRTMAVVAAVLTAAAGRPVRFVSRSDSTLRGHVHAEPEAIRAALRAAGRPEPRSIVFAPAFPAAGRVTRGGKHLLLNEAGEETPAHESTYAQDATFGYASSDLAEVVAARSAGQLAASDVGVVPAGSAELVIEALKGENRWLAVDAESESDLLAIADALGEADPSGEDVIVRCSPGLIPALLGVPLAGPATRTGDSVGRGGLVVVGSHVARTTRQLERLLAVGDAVIVTLDVDALVDASPAVLAAVAADVASLAAEHLQTNHVVIATSRTVRQWDDPDRSLAFARRVSETLVEVTRTLLALGTIEFVVAKGGITSSDIATLGLGIRRAFVRGRVGAGILWEPVGNASPPIALVPGNIGADEGLADAVLEMSRQRADE